MSTPSLGHEPQRRLIEHLPQAVEDRDRAWRYLSLVWVLVYEEAELCLARWSQALRWMDLAQGRVGGDQCQHGGFVAGSRPTLPKHPTLRPERTRGEITL